MKNQKQTILLFAGIFSIAPLGMAEAAVIVSQPLNPTSPGEFSNLGPSNQQVADDFVLTQGTILDSISWYGRYGAPSVVPPLPTDFSIRFFEDSAGAPTVSPFLQLDIAVNPVDSGFEYIPGVGAGAIPWYSYSTPLSGVTLGAGSYWVSVVENDAGTDLVGNTQWLWADSDTSGTRAFRDNDNEAWTASLDINHAFSLTGTVIPIPAAIWLFGTGLLALVGIARRKTA